MSRNSKIRKLMPILMGALCSCSTSPQYRYIPSSLSGNNAGHVEQGKEIYRVPAVNPNGSVRIMSGGIVKLKADEGGEKFRVLAVRMVLSNESSDAPWTLQTDQQSIAFDESGKITPVFAKTNDGAVTQLSVARGEMKVVHLFFKLPDQDNPAEKIPEFDFHWQLKAGTELVEQTTAFDRVNADPYIYASPYDYPYPYAGPYPGPFVGTGYYGWGTPVYVGPHPMGPPPRPVIMGH